MKGSVKLYGECMLRDRAPKGSEMKVSLKGSRNAPSKVRCLCGS